MLAHGADPNKPPHTLAYAINQCAFDVCKLLLEKGANVNSEFRTDDRMLALANRSLSKVYEEKVRESRETALHTAYRIGAERKINVLLNKQANTELRWIGMKPKEIEPLYSMLEHSSLYFVSCSNESSQLCNLEGRSPINIVRNCRSFIRSDETKLIVKSVIESIQNICKHVSKVLEVSMASILTGS